MERGGGGSECGVATGGGGWGRGELGMGNFQTVKLWEVEEEEEEDELDSGGGREGGGGGGGGVGLEEVVGLSGD